MECFACILRLDGIYCSNKYRIYKHWTKIISIILLQLDDAALQLYKDGDYGSYLDLEASISEQQEEFEGFQSKWVWCIVTLTNDVSVSVIIIVTGNVEAYNMTIGF